MKIKNIIRKRLEAMYTVENAIIIPLIFMMLVSICIMGMYMHDRIVLKNALEQAAIQYEYEFINSWDGLSVGNDSEDKKKESEEAFCGKVKDYIAAKSLFLNDIDIKVDSKKSSTKITANATFPLVSKFVSKSINTSVMISVNNPKKWIRIVNALKEMVGNENE